MDDKFQKSLKSIPSHQKSNDSKCQFSEIGCVESKNHLDNNNSLHLNLLMNTLQNFKNEIEISKEKSNKSETLINNLNVELIQMKEENNSLKSQLKTLETFNQNQDTINNQIDIRLNGFKNDIDVLNISIDKLDCKIIECAPYEYKIENFRYRMHKLFYYDNYMNLSPSNSSTDECIFTDKFLSAPSGYTMQLNIYPNGKETDIDQNLTIEFGIVEGKYDDMLPWPMKREVEIAVMDQDTNEVHVSEIFHFNRVHRRFKCTFFKPSTRSDDDDNYFYGTRNLIDLDELTNNDYICMNNSIVVKCFVN